MSVLGLILNGLVAAAFLFYGINCLYSKYMIAEFKRFGLTNIQRQLTGALQVAGALGLFWGFWYIGIGFISALGLAVLMLLGFAVRLKIKDSFLQSLPSFIFMILNTYLAFKFYSLF